MPDQFNQRELKVLLNSVYERAFKLHSVLGHAARKNYRMANGQRPNKDQLQQLSDGIKEHENLIGKLKGMVKDDNN